MRSIHSSFARPWLAMPWLPALLLPALLMAPLPPAAAQAPPVIDNERVLVWDVVLDKGVSAPATPHDLDAVIMFLEGGRIRTVVSGGKVSDAHYAFGDALFVPRGTDAIQTMLSNGRAHEVIIALKDVHVPAVPNTTGLPAAFPRPGAVQVLDNERVVVWQYSWTPGVPTRMHFHDKDVVVAYRYDGTLKSVTPDGAVTVNAYRAGEIRFNKANRAHYEDLVTDRQSAMITELK